MGHTQCKIRIYSTDTLQKQIKELDLDNFETIIGLGGKEYRQVLDEAFVYFNKKVHFPFAGLPIGKAMQATKKAIETRKMLP